MTASDDKRWIEKAKSVAVGVRNKSNLWQTSSLETTAVARFNAKPPSPEKLYMLDRVVASFWAQVHHLGMKYTKDTSIPVCVSIRTSFWRKNHNIAMCSRVHGILVVAHVISRIVYP
jgi:hypothetical protein